MRLSFIKIGQFWLAASLLCGHGHGFRDAHRITASATLASSPPARAIVRSPSPDSTSPPMTGPAAMPTLTTEQARLKRCPCRVAPRRKGASASRPRRQPGQSSRPPAGPPPWHPRFRGRRARASRRAGLRQRLPAQPGDYGAAAGRSSRSRPASQGRRAAVPGERPRGKAADLGKKRADVGVGGERTSER